MKKIGIFGIALLLCIGLASASTGFNLQKSVTVKGDWQWTGSWQKTFPTTATYNYQVSSPLATSSNVGNYDNLGTAWKYIGEASVSVNKPATFQNTLIATTVNDPLTTPSTGGYTRFNYQELTQITDLNAASSVSVSASGFGYLGLNSEVVTDSESIQLTHVGVNE